ncbi:MAG: class I SAM-dependent methyltransferase [Chloroflexota bacterium]|nr:class I SAM-dependent methyltransferase [Chloroflexota bacterium]
MAFDVAAGAYDRYMGRYSRVLSPKMADFAGIGPGQRALDVGCGPGTLTAELAARLGADAVTAVDPWAEFVEAVAARNPGVTVRQAAAEELPFDDHEFDVALAQLVVHFMDDPLAGLTEMRRVTRRRGVVAACVWDLAGGRAPISLVLQAARALNATDDDESLAAGARDGHLTELFEAVGLRDIQAATFEVSVEHTTFDEWWDPYTLDVAAGSCVAMFDAALRDEIRQRCRELLGDGPFTITSVAWAARGLA